MVQWNTILCGLAVQNWYNDLTWLVVWLMGLAASLMIIRKMEQCFNVMWIQVFTKCFSIPVSLLYTVGSKTYYYCYQYHIHYHHYYKEHSLWIDTGIGLNSDYLLQCCLLPPYLDPNVNLWHAPSMVAYNIFSFSFCSHYLRWHSLLESLPNEYKKPLIPQNGCHGCWIPGVTNNWCIGCSGTKPVKLNLAEQRSSNQMVWFHTCHPDDHIDG